MPPPTRVHDRPAADPVGRAPLASAPRAPPRRAGARRTEGAPLIVATCILAALLFAAGLATVDARGHAHPAIRRDGGALPGVTLDADLDPAHAPPLVVTSLRSQGAAWRGGVRVGDRLEAIDGIPVPGRAALRRVLAADPARVIVLHLRRGDGTVDVRLDRGHGAGRDDT